MITSPAKPFRAIVRYQGVEYVYLVKARHSRHAKQVVFNTVPNPPWQPIIDELRARYSMDGGEFIGNHPTLSWGITPTEELCSGVPQLLYSINLQTGEMVA